MKNPIKIVFVILAIGISSAAVQSIDAKELYNVEGAIESLSTKPNVVVIDGTAIHGLKFNYLCNQYTICLMEGEEVSIWYYDFLCDDGTTKYMASSITVGDVTIMLRN